MIMYLKKINNSIIFKLYINNCKYLTKQNSIKIHIIVSCLFKINNLIYNKINKVILH